MTLAKRIAAIISIYLCIVIAWNVLGRSVQDRTTAQDNKVKEEVGKLWGTIQHQRAPVIYYKREGENRAGDVIQLESSRINVTLNLDQRRKGLLWYSPYRISFDGQYTVKNPFPLSKDVFFTFYLPSQGTVYEDFSLVIDGREIDNVNLQSESIVQPVTLLPGNTSEISLRYRTYGMDEWWYWFGDGVAQMKNFTLDINTDFDRLDIPQKGIQPTKRERLNRGWKLQWSYSKILSGAEMGLVMPKRLNPGPWVSNLTGFAPLSLFLFFFIIVVFSAIKEVRLHPVHYFFIAASFFSYHLLLAYLADHLSLQAAFWVSSLVSLFMVISYMRIVSSHKFAFMQIGLSQLVFLIAFSYSFFFEGYTGLAITILSIATLFLIMQITARFDWERMFFEQRSLRNE